LGNQDVGVIWGEILWDLGSFATAGLSADDSHLIGLNEVEDLLFVLEDWEMGFGLLVHGCWLFYEGKIVNNGIYIGILLSRWHLSTCNSTYTVNMREIVPYVRWPHQWISFSTLTTKWRVDKSKI
jgi:hypothetical protein